jgi:hypothetical protein
MKRFFIPCLFPLLFSGCFVASSFQNAHLLPAGVYEIQPAVSVSSGTIGSNHSVHSFLFTGIQTGYGVTDRFNVRSRYFAFEEFGLPAIHFFELESKISIIKGSIAASLPVGYYSSEILSISPSLIYSARITENLSLNTIPRLLLMYSTEDGSLHSSPLALNEGLSIFLIQDRLIITPEVGIATSTPDFLFSYGIAFSFIR